jgi:hypothetical protein
MRRRRIVVMGIVMSMYDVLEIMLGICSFKRAS